MNALWGKNKFSCYLEEGSLSFICAIISVIILPIHVYFIAPFMILWVICWILENYQRFNKIFKIRRSYLLLFILVLAFYFWQAIGVFYSDDTQMAFLNLFGRLSFILFPIVLIYPGIQIKKRIGFLTSLFALSTFFYMIFCFGYALYKSLNIVEGTLVFDAIPQDYIWLNYFYGSDLTLTQHPSYISMYVLLSSVISLEAFFNYSQRFWVRLGWLVIGIILLLSLYFLSSRAAILIGIIMLSLYFGLKLNEIGKKKLTWLMVIFLVIAVSYVTFKLADQSQNSIKSLFFSQQANNKLTRDPRSVIWKSALDVSGKNLLVGVGIGDVRNELAREYYKRGEVNMAKERLNAHNQFLEILLESGIIGLGIFLLIITIMFYIAFVDKNIIYGVFLVTIILFFLFESILYRLAGVTFFSLFSFLLIHNNEENKLKE